MRTLGEHLRTLLIVGAMLGAVAMATLHRLSSDGRSVAARRVAVVLLAGWLLLAAYATLAGLRPASDGPSSYVNLTPFASFRTAYPRQHIEVVANLALFMPLGALLPFVVRRHRLLAVLLCGTAASVSIECLQYALHVGRFADVDDVMLNVVGAVAGWVVWVVWVGSRPGSFRWLPRQDSNL